MQSHFTVKPSLDNPVVIAEHQSLRLRTIGIDDWQLMIDVFNHPDFIKYVGDRNIKTDVDSQSYIKDILFPSNLEGVGLFIVELQSESGWEAVGTCGLMKRPYLDLYDLGFGLTQARSGQGIGYRAASLILDYAKDQLKIEGLYAIVDPQNSTSIGLLQKLGFEYKEPILVDQETISVFQIVLK